MKSRVIFSIILIGIILSFAQEAYAQTFWDWFRNLFFSSTQVVTGGGTFGQTNSTSVCKDCTVSCSNFSYLGNLSAGKELTAETCDLNSSNPRDSFYFYAFQSGKVTISIDGPEPCDFDIFSQCVGCGYSSTCSNTTSSCDETCTFQATSGNYYQFYVRRWSGSGKATVKVSMEQPTTCSVCYIKDLECPSSVTTGQTFQINFKFYGTGSINKYEHRSLWQGNTRIDCKYGGDYPECTWHFDSFTLTAPSSPGNYTYVVKCYGSASLSESNCDRSDDSKNCTVNVISAPTGCVNCGQAKPISSGQSISTCSLNKGQNKQYDFFKFDANTNGFIVVRMDNISGSGSDVDLDLVVHSTCTDSPLENVECMSVLPGSDTCLLKVNSGTSYKIRIWDCQFCPGTDKTARLTVNFYENLNGFNCDNNLQTGLMLLRASKYKVNSGEQFTLSILTTPNCNGKTVLFFLKEAKGIVGSCTLNSNGECSIPINLPCQDQACIFHFLAILDLDGGGDVDENEPISNGIIVGVKGVATTTTTKPPTTTTTQASTTTTQPTTTTTPTTIPTTTTQPPTTTIPSNKIECEECFSNSKCKCTLKIACDNGVWILQNKEGKPLEAGISSSIPPTTVEFETKQPGKISVIAVCFKDTTPDSYGPYVLEVKQPFLDCDRECEVLKPCECRVNGCNEGYFQAIMGTTLISREKINKVSYSTSFVSEKSGVVDVSVTCSNPAKYAEIQIPISTAVTEKKFSARNFNSKEIEGKYKLTLEFNNNLGEDVTIVFTVTKEGLATSKTFTVSPGSGTASEIFDCKNLGAGSFQISWKAFKSSDKKNPIAWSKPEEMVSIEC